jgi:hypothetical protein
MDTSPVLSKPVHCKTDGVLLRRNQSQHGGSCDVDAELEQRVWIDFDRDYDSEKSGVN